jgi:hypothetical protein
LSQDYIVSRRTPLLFGQKEIDAELDLPQYQFVSSDQNKGSKPPPTKLPVSRRSQVQNIKTLWQQETHFSDWLATQDGIDLLTQDLGIAIENPRREGKGANFSCDIVANIVGDESHIVVIENQFGRTDHNHLAKLLTYAAVHKAVVGIWIAEEAADDHRQVIDWLNENTPNTVSLYLAELKAFTIGPSPAAPQLDVVCRPNVTMKQANSDLSEGDKKRRQWRLAFWTDIHNRMKSEKLPFRLQKPSEDHWSSIAVGRSGFHIEMLLTPKNQSIAVQLIIKPEDWKDLAFKQLNAQSTEIEKEIGATLEWRPMVGKDSSRILLEEKIDPKVEANRKAVCDWFAEWTPKMFLAFSNRVKALSEPE